MIFDPDKFNIRWLGAPMGEEAKIFLEALLRIGTMAPGLTEQAAAVLEKIDAPRKIKVFVSPLVRTAPSRHSMPSRPPWANRTSSPWKS